jgi:hypothetical protein
LTRLFGSVQLEFPGVLTVADGRYVLRDVDCERVLVLETLGAPAPPRRRRRRAREVDPEAPPAALPLGRVTVVRAHLPFEHEDEARAWLDSSVDSEEQLDALLAEAFELLNRALHAQSVASADPSDGVLSPRDAVTARLGYGSGEQVAAGELSEARAIDPNAGTSRKRQRREELRPQERLAAVLGGRERFDPCEVLILRARADLDAGRNREAALQLRIGLEALLVEFTDPPADSSHDEDMAALTASRTAMGELANAALQSSLNEEQLHRAQELVAICERVIRRRRILRG